MGADRITVRIPEALAKRLRRRSRHDGQSESELVREALETYLGADSASRSAYQRAEAAGLIGIVKEAPADLSTNPEHFEGFGQSK